MNRDDVIRMAHEVGIQIASQMDTIDPRNVYPHELERFAALVAAAEREACAKVCYEIAPNIHAADQYAATIRARGEQGVVT